MVALFCNCGITDLNISDIKITNYLTFEKAIHNTTIKSLTYNNCIGQKIF